MYSLAVSPLADLAAAVDCFGRVLLVDTQQLLVARMWKGEPPQVVLCPQLRSAGSKYSVVAGVQDVCVSEWCAVCRLP